MKRITKYILDEKDIEQMIPYRQLAECENKLNTGRARRLMNNLCIEPVTVERYRNLAHIWHCISGCPDTLELTEQELKDWHKIGCLVFDL